MQRSRSGAERTGSLVGHRLNSLYECVSSGHTSSYKRPTCSLTRLCHHPRSCSSYHRNTAFSFTACTDKVAHKVLCSVPNSLVNLFVRFVLWPASRPIEELHRLNFTAVEVAAWFCQQKQIHNNLERKFNLRVAKRLSLLRLTISYI